MMGDTHRPLEFLQARYRDDFESKLEQAYPSVPWGSIKIIDMPDSRLRAMGISQTQVELSEIHLAHESTLLTLVHELTHFIVPGAGHLAPFPQVLLSVIETLYDSETASQLEVKLQKLGALEVDNE